MFKRPSKRVKITGHQGPVSIPEDSYLHTITHPGPPNFYEPVKHPVYHQESYLKTLKQNYKDYDLPFKDPDLPKYVPVVKQEPNKEPKLLYGDHVQVTLRVLKNGSVRVKVNAAIADMYDKYCRQGKKPPFKVVLQAYKSHGFSKEYLEKLKIKNEKQKQYASKFEKIFEKLFEKEPLKKTKLKKQKEKKKEEPEEDIIPVEEEEEEEEDDVPGDEGEMDVEPVEEEEVVEEEEYFSEPET
jgi:hypothetical protein